MQNYYEKNMTNPKLTNKTVLDALIAHLDFAILNQEGLKKENETMGFPEWNKGYLEALLDIKRTLPTAQDTEK